MEACVNLRFNWICRQGRPILKPRVELLFSETLGSRVKTYARCRRAIRCSSPSASVRFGAFDPGIRSPSAHFSLSFIICRFQRREISPLFGALAVKGFLPFPNFARTQTTSGGSCVLSIAHFCIYGTLVKLARADQLRPRSLIDQYWFRLIIVRRTGCGSSHRTRRVSLMNTAFMAEIVSPTALSRVVGRFGR